MPLLLLIVLGIAAVGIGAVALHKALGDARKKKYSLFSSKEVGKTAEPCIKVQDATPEQATKVVKAHKKAGEMINKAIERLKAAKSKPDPLVKKYFDINGTDEEDQKKLDKLVDNFKKMEDKTGSIDYEVENKKYKPGKSNTVAYVYDSMGDVHLCFPAFDYESENGRASTVVHEISHYSAGTKDHAYDWETKKWNKMSQKDKMENADSYSEFAEEA